MSTTLRETVRDAKGELQNLTDEELCDRVAATKDEEAFTILYTRHANMIRQYILLFVGYDEMEADDILSITFMKVFDHARSRNQEGKFFPWLFVIARNLCIDYTKNIHYTRHISFPTTEEELTDPVISKLLDEQASSSIENELIIMEEIGFLREDINKLPPYLRKILLLYIAHDIPGKEVAVMLHTTVGAVKMNAYRARTCLKAFRRERESCYKTPEN